MTTASTTHSTSAPSDASDGSAGDGSAVDSALDAVRSITPTYVRPERLFVKGEGCWLETDDGARFLDMTSGIAVTALGHGSSVVTDALHAAADGLHHVSNLYHTAPALDLARALTERSFATQVFFSNSGSEANEAAIKFARLAGGEDRRTIAYFEGAFHGRTFASLAATDRPDYKEPFEPLPGGYTRLAWNDTAALDAIDEHTAAVLVEPIQGESGVRVPDDDWLPALRERCHATGALLVFDEVQCGLGRTGSLFAYESFGVVPDMVTLAKPLAGGLPMGATLLGERAAAAVRPGCHGTTFGGGPVVSAVALAVLRAVDTLPMREHVAREGEHLRARLAKAHPSIQDVRGRGLMVGVAVEDVPRVHAAAFEEGLLVVPAGHSTVRFLPPLVVSREELDDAVDRFTRALERVAQAGGAA